MGRRIDKITVQLDVYIEFEGRHSITFSYEPQPGDVLAELACAKNDAMLLAAAKLDASDKVLV